MLEGTRDLSNDKRLAAADMVSIVNGERNDLIDEIDEFIYQAAHGKVKLKTPKVKIYKKFKIDPKAEKMAEELARTQSSGKKTKKKAKKNR